MSSEWSFGTVPVSAGGGTESSGASMPGVEMERGVLESSVSSAPSCDSRSQRATAADGGEPSSPGTRDQTGSSEITRNESGRIPLTVKHILGLVECANLRDIREKYVTVSSLADLFDRVDNHTVIDFIKETHFYHQL